VKEHVLELVRPSPVTLKLVSAWLRHHNIRSSSISTTHGGAWLKVTDVLLSQANPLLGASYQLYRNAKTNDTIIRTVPAVLHAHIQTVAPTTYFDSTRVMRQTQRRRSFGAAQVASGKAVTGRSSRAGTVPSYLRWMYGTVTYTPAATDTNKLAVVGFENQYPSLVDLNTFVTDYDANAVGAAYTVELVNGGGYVPNDPSASMNTYIQYTGTMAYPTPLIFYSTGALVPEFLGLLEYLIDQPTLPQTINIAGGIDEHTISKEFATSLCNMFAELGVLGVSVLIASGTDGVGDGNCVDGDGNVRFIPEFPASCMCGSPLPKYKSLIRPPSWFHRSLYHCRRRYNKHQPRDRRDVLRRRLFVPL
jgi:tripeptidyl-peptidase-1